MSADRKPVERQKSKQRSRVGNGSVVLANIDNRSPIARRIKELLADYVAHLGGEPSEVQRTICKRAAALVVWAESAESKMANGEELDIASYTTATNTLHRYLSSLGMHRAMRDVTPSLKAYVAKTYGSAGK